MELLQMQQGAAAIADGKDSEVAKKTYKFWSTQVSFLTHYFWYVLTRIMHTSSIRSFWVSFENIHFFCSGQPVPKIDEEITAAANECISPDVPLDQLRQEPYSLPQGFEWDTLNLDDPLVVS